MHDIDVSGAQGRRSRARLVCRDPSRKRCSYADKKREVRAEGDGRPCPASAGRNGIITEIALRNNLPKKFLDTIMLELRNAGFLRSKKGPGGGYALARPASEIRVGQVIRTLDGPLAPIRCASRTAYEMCDDCSDPENCHVRRSMIVVRDAVANILDNMTLAQFAASEKDAADVVLAPLRSEAG